MQVVSETKSRNLLPWGAQLKRLIFAIKWVIVAIKWFIFAIKWFIVAIKWFIFAIKTIIYYYCQNTYMGCFGAAHCMCAPPPLIRPLIGRVHTATILWEMCTLFSGLLPSTPPHICIFTHVPKIMSNGTFLALDCRPRVPHTLVFMHIAHFVPTSQTQKHVNPSRF